MRNRKVPKRQYTDEFKVEATRLAESIGGHEAARRLGVPVATLGKWKRRSASAGTGAPEVALNATTVLTRRPVSELEAENSRLCRVLSVSRSGYCQWRVRPLSARTLANQALDTKVAAIHLDSRRSYGRPRIMQQLRQQGECVSAERVRQSLQRQGLRPVYRRAHVATTDSAHCLPVATNILDRRFDGWQPNQAWVGDITYAATGEGWLYLAAVMDLASRRIVG